MVSSRRWTRSPTRTSIQPPMASRFGPSSLALNSIKWPRPCVSLRQMRAGALRLTTQDVDRAVEIEVGERGAAGLREADDAGDVAHLDELAVALLHQEIAGILLGEVLHRGDVALGDEEVGATVVVDVLELRVPAGARPHVAACVGAMRGHAIREGDVGVAGLCRRRPPRACPAAAACWSAMLVRK